MQRELKKIKRFLRKKGILNTAAICHQNADPDALCSAYALRYLAETLGCKTKFTIISDEVSSITRNVASTLKIDYLTEVELEKFDAFIMIDACSPEQLGKFYSAPFTKPTMIIDHHIPKQKSVFSASIVDDKAVATAEIVTRLFEEAKKQPPKEVSTALLVGLLYDSRNFYIATAKTLRAAAFLLEKGADYTVAQDVLRGTMDRAERIARLKAAKRAEIVDIDGWIIAFTHVGSFEASASRGLIELGADVAIVGSEKKGEVKVSGRATRGFHEKTGVHLGEVMREIEKRVKGSGGGHSLAAGFNGEGRLDEIFREIQQVLEEKIKRRT